MEYDKFLESKKLKYVPVGFETRQHFPSMKPFQKAVLDFACRKGRALVALDTGLGKTFTWLSWAHNVWMETGLPVIGFAPLCVGQQTEREAKKWGIDAKYYLEDDNFETPIVIANYERIHKFDFSKFGGIVLDESGIIKGIDSKIKKSIMEASQSIFYRLCCSATPAPNDYMEIGAQSEFLGVMTMSEMLATFFTHDASNTSKWALKGHGRDAFWEWMASWSVVIKKPSDIGFDDTGYDLPPLNTIIHIIESESTPGHLMAVEACDLSQRLQARKRSVDVRCQTIADIVNASSESWVIWCHLNDEGDLLEKLIHGAVQVAGRHPIEKKEKDIMDFSNGETRVLISKVSITGYGLNWQHCHNMAFVGMNDSFEEYYQAIRREWRFGQEHAVDVHVAVTEEQMSILRNVEEKQKRNEIMSQKMIAHMQPAMEKELVGSVKTTDTYATGDESGENWRLMLGDCVERIREIDDNSIDFSVFSPPFASLYTYSASDRDMGNVRSHGEFYEHFQFLVDELMRVIKPGRNISFHCMNLPTSKQTHGVIGLSDFRGELIRMFVAKGFIYHSEVCIWKDPVTAMQRTKALGLLHKQVKKDSAMSRNGLPDYVVTMRKPGKNMVPVVHSPSAQSVDTWQKWASPIWMDIDQGNTVNRKKVLGTVLQKDEDDQKHLCPLQVDVIERLVGLYSNPDELILSPFAGVGSEGFMSLKMKRRFVGIELKKLYFDQAVRNISAAGTNGSQLTMDFGDE